MAPQNPTLLIIHGGWHVPASYSKLTSTLRASGYEVHIPRVPSMNGARPPNADLATDSDIIRSYAEALVEAERNVIALMHSYGGQVGTDGLAGLGVDERQAQGKRGGVVHLIYMTAFALVEGGSMVAKVAEFGHEELLPLAFDFADDGTVVSRDPRKLLISAESGIGDDEVDAYIDILGRWNGRCMYQEIAKCAWRDIPVSYIYTTRDMTVPLEYQMSMVERMRNEGREVRTYELETGHCPNLTATLDVVDAVNMVVGEELMER